MMFKSQPTVEQLAKNFPAIFAEHEKETLSEKYLYIPTHKLINGLEREGFRIVGAKQQRSNLETNRQTAKHVVYMSHESMKDNYLTKVGQELPMIALTNSHNGASSFQIDTAFFRLVCSNGLLAPNSSLNSARIIHKIGMENDVISAAYKVIENFPETIKQIESMKAEKLSRPEQYLLAQAAQNVVFEPEQIELNKSKGVDIAQGLLRVRRNADTGADLWSTFNVIQENVIKGGLRILSANEKGQLNRSKTRAVNSIDRDAKLNRELMSLALEMQKLKAAA